MVRKLTLIAVLILGMTFLVAVAAQAGRIGFKNETSTKCYVFKWQTLLWAKSESKWIPDGPPKTRAVGPGQHYIYEGLIDGIDYLEYQPYSDSACTNSSGESRRVWHTPVPAAWTTLNVIVDKSGNVNVKQLRGK